MDMIKISSNNQYSVITICKYDTYQDNQTYKVTTKEQPSNNKVTTKEQPSNTTNTLTNVNTLKNVISENKKPIFLIWLNYKKEIKKEVKSKSTYNTLVKRFNKESLLKCEWVVNQSIENNWQGLFWDKYVIQKSKKPTDNLTF